MTRAPATVDKSHAITPLTPPPVPATPSDRNFLLPSTTSPRNPANRLWAQAHQRRTFLKHLKQWSLSHDSSTHFQGKISLLPPNQNRIEELALGKSVQCVLTDSSFTDFRKKIVVRLFEPQMITKSKERSAMAEMKKDSMDAYDGRGRLAELEVDMSTSIKGGKTQSISQTSFSPASRYYKLVIRCGSGWLTAREYLNRFYLTHFAARNPGPNANSILKTANQTFSTRSQALGPQPAANDTVTIQPLFHPFLRLPQELQEMIWMTAAGLTKDYDLCPETRLRVHPKRIESPISLSTLLRISPSITATMQPYILHRTAFHFGLTGTTNFLWQSGPVNRSHVRRLAFHFGRGALLHCVRWLAPDEIFDLLQPPVQREMGGLPFFWRAQLRAMAKEVHLRELIIDLRTIRQADVAMVVRILKELFGSVERVSFVETDYLGATTVVAEGDERLKELDTGASWRELTKGYVDRYRAQVGLHNYHFELGIADMSEGELDGLMDKEGAFFDS